MFQKRDAAVPQFWIWKKCRITETTPSSKFSDTDFSKKSFEKSPLWKLPESDIFLTFDVFEEKFVWRDKTYAPWNCWVITFTLTPCDDFKNDLEPPQSFIISFEFISYKKQGSIDRRQMKSKLSKSDQSLLDSLIPKKTKLSNLGKNLAPLIKHQESWFKMPISLHVSIILNHWSQDWASNISMLSDATTNL